MKQVLVSIDLAAATAKTVVLPVFDECRIVGVAVVPNAAPGAVKTVSVKKVGGNVIFSGDMSGTAKAVAKLTKTATEADAKQAITPAAGIEITAQATSACNITVALKLDDHLISQIG